MKRAISISLLVIVALGCESTGGSSDREHHHAAATDQKQAVMFGVKQYIAALTSNDIPTLEKLWADDLIFVNARGQVQNKTQRIADLQSGSTVVKSVDFQDEKLRTYGNAVVHVSRCKLQATYGGQESSGDYRITMLWSKHADGWQIHGIQLTAIQK